MIEQEPSRTAFAAAAHRAAHQVLEGGRIFSDPLAAPILGLDPEALKDPARGEPASQRMRFFVVARSEIAESLLAEGVERRGVRQLVVLGAGLDTYAYRNPHSDRLKVFEVDHPATQAWKRRRLSEAGVAIPAAMTFAPVDFEREDLGERLAAAGLRPDLRTFFMWLGVVPYLSRSAIESTLGLVGGHPGGAELVFDYGEPPQSLDLELRAQQAARAERVAALGEPFLSYFAPDEIEAALRRHGFAQIDDRGPRRLVERYFGAAAAERSGERGGHVLFAATA